MLRFFIFMQIIQTLSGLYPRLTECIQDEQCTDGFYCNTSSYLCEECVKCSHGGDIKEINTTTEENYNCTNVDCNERKITADRSPISSGKNKNSEIREASKILDFFTFPVFIWICAICAAITIFVIFIYFVRRI